MDADHCPKCSSKAVVAGRLSGEGWYFGWFEPSGMRFFRLLAWGVRVLQPSRACLACGLVWTHLRPEDLRAFIDKYGKAEAKLKLLPLRKGPLEQDLA